MPSHEFGSFLVARPVLRDPNFSRTVVLLLQHTAEGAFGLVVNRLVESEPLPFPVYSGGPCASEGLFMLHGEEDWLAPEEASGREIAPGIYLGDSSCVEKVNAAATDDRLHCRMFTGYSGWGPNQLEKELAAGAWAVVPASGHLLFETPIEDLWSILLPPRIPQPSVN